MKRAIKYILINLIILLLFTACSLYDDSAVAGGQPEMTGYIPAKAGNYDSKDTAVVVRINNNESKITFQTTAIGKRYTLYYDGATIFEDKYGTGMSIAQLKTGDLVDVTFLKQWRRLDTLKLSEGQFNFDNINDYQFSNDGKHVMIAGEQYTIDDNVAVISDKGTLTLMDVNPVDVLSLKGFNHTIDSIVIEQSHGYLRLINDSYFVGGWIEVSQRQICQIEEDMILAVPVGTYTVTVSNTGSSGQETVTIEQGKEYELDVSGWQTEAKYGDIIFTVSPAKARVYIDGVVADISEAVSLEYGIHQMIVVADGYQTISKYIKVGSASASLDIEMEAKEKGIADSLSQNDTDDNVINPPVSDNKAVVSYNIINPPDTVSKDSVSSNINVSSNTSVSANANNTVSTTNKNKVYIDSPEGAEVYVDGGYVGIAPVSFAKKEGSIVVTLRKAGHETRSYTLNIDGESKDSNYSFSELTPIR